MVYRQRRQSSCLALYPPICERYFRNPFQIIVLFSYNLEDTVIWMLDLNLDSLQILGQNSGWQPIHLTEVITASDVKKAYRKATLYVHPDKLQQRGASIQQKYVCEKVFDLLKVNILSFVN
jgi:hypothetical protein